MDGPLCRKCARQLRLEMAQILGHTPMVAVQQTRYLKGSGRLWLWHRPYSALTERQGDLRLVVDESIYDQVRSWLAEGPALPFGLGPVGVLH